MRTQVGIVGAGPAGLLLAHLLRRDGIESVILENRSRQYVIERVRAGLLEQGTVDLMTELGLADRLHREGLVHHGLALRFGGKSHRIPLTDLTGKVVTIYGQNEVMKDLIDAHLDAGGEILFEAEAEALTDLQTTPRIRFRRNGEETVLACDFVAGCDGFHGMCRPAIPDSALTVYDREYPFAWIGILSESPPVSDELIYVHHERGFALFTMRSPMLSRLYLQCRPDDDIADWPDARIWEELHLRLGHVDSELIEGNVTQKAITPMRSFVVAPMRYARLFIAGDAAHIVPPTGAKGLNLAAADVRVLARAFDEHYRHGRSDLLDRYSEICLRRVWKSQRFSWWMTSMLHRFDDQSRFDRQVQLAELDYVTGSRAAMTALAENYVGLPFEEL
ncbi:MAG: 4-hydroxybenzoate 3-monooxygenase [Xanthobacteraceae bacterium]